MDTTLRRLSADEIAQLSVVRFEEYRRITRWLVLGFCILMLLLWTWDWVFDPINAPQTLSLRIAGSLALFIPALVMNCQFGINASGILLYIVITLVVVIYTMVLGTLHNGLVIGIGGYLYFFLSSVLLGLPFSFRLNAAGTLCIMFLPHLVGDLVEPGFPHLLYATMIWPAGFIAVFFHWAAGKMILERLHYRSKMESLSLEDPLTGLLNRRALQHDYKRARSISARENEQLSLIMLDVDNFKGINDTYGHAAGDQVLVTLAQIMQQSYRASDSLARIGGEEFVVLMPDTDLGSATRSAERLRRQVAGTRIPLDNSKDTQLAFTISVGVTRAVPTENLGHLLDRADQALYQAKNGGRNRVEHIP